MSAFDFNHEITRSNTKLTRSIRVFSCFFVVSVFFISCQNAAQKEANLSAADKTELSRINQILTGGQPLTPQDF